MNNTTQDTTQNPLPQVVNTSLCNIIAIIICPLHLHQIHDGVILCCPENLPNKSFRKVFSGQLSERYRAQNANFGLLQIGIFYVLILVFKPP